MRSIPSALVPCGRAATAIPEMMSLGMVDRGARISRRGDFRAVPLLPGNERRAEEMGFEVVLEDAHEIERRTPQEIIADRLSGLPPEIKELLPWKWEFVGDIAIIRMDRACDPCKDLIGRVYADVLGVSTVCVDRGGVAGEFRRPDVEVIHGDRTESVRLENGILYAMDVAEVMFASGNVAERRRMGEMDCKGETVVDMFAGIGYFTLPIAKYSGAERVIACEKNPDSYRFLLRNIELNGVGDRVIPVHGDNRDLVGEHLADRVIMGYVQRTSDFLPKAISLLRAGGIVHYHDTFYVHEHRERIARALDKACGPVPYEILEIREVKSFAPLISHYVAEVRIG